MSRLAVIVSALLFAGLLVFGTAAMAASGAGSDFDHFSTGFPLSGAHTQVECDHCHLRGVFKGTPTQCDGCHTGRIAPGKTSRHPKTTNNCDDCHTTFSWDTKSVDHSAVMGTCGDCHQKPRNHIATDQECGTCHNTLSWDVARFDHTGIVDGCSACHKKSRNHVQASNNCEECHNPRSWDDVRFSHVGIVSGCNQCHLKDKPTNHTAQQTICEDCHLPVGWTTNVKFDHTTTTDPCLTCHSDVVRPRAVPMNHSLLTTEDCGLCHRSRDGWDLSVRMNHQYIQSGPDVCLGCHSNVTKPTRKPADHSLFPNTCGSCHNAIRDASWSASRMNHNVVNTSVCSVCHAEPAGHRPPTNGQDCGVCHYTSNWSRTK